MTTKREIDDLHALADQWRRFGADWDRIAEEALRDAFTVSGVLEDIWNRTPKSLRQRYEAMYKGVEILKVYKNGRIKMTKDKDAVLYGSDRISPATAAAREARLNRLGMDALANSLLPGSHDWNSLKPVRSGDTTTVRIGSSLPYARRMHEATKPAEGQYWAPGKKRGWSAKMSGNKFLEKPVEDNNDALFAEFIYQVERQMRNRGLM